MHIIKHGRENDNNEQSNATNENKEDDNNENEEKINDDESDDGSELILPDATFNARPHNFTFPGFIAFYSHGPFKFVENSIDETMLTCLIANASKKVGDGVESRRDMKKKELESKNKARSTQIAKDNDTFVRGLPAGEQLKCNLLKQRKKEAVVRNIDVSFI